MTGVKAATEGTSKSTVVAAASKSSSPIVMSHIDRRSVD